MILQKKMITAENGGKKAGAGITMGVRNAGASALRINRSGQAVQCPAKGKKLLNIVEKEPGKDRHADFHAAPAAGMVLEDVAAEKHLAAVVAGHGADPAANHSEKRLPAKNHSAESLSAGNVPVAHAKADKSI